MDSASFTLAKPLISIPSLSHHRQLRPASLVLCKTTADSNSPTPSTNDGGQNTPPPVNTPPEAAYIRFRRGTRRKSRQKQQKDGVSSGVSRKAEAPKDWGSMSLAEKAIELYMGEKGLLFWVNKLAYASIFVIIGAWILFRFVGPALNLYQLDSPPLSPTSMFKG